MIDKSAYKDKKLACKILDIQKEVDRLSKETKKLNEKIRKSKQNFLICGCASLVMFILESIIAAYRHIDATSYITTSYPLVIILALCFWMIGSLKE